MQYGCRMARIHQQFPEGTQIDKQPSRHAGLSPLVALARVLARSAAHDFLRTSEQHCDDVAKPPNSGEHYTDQTRIKR